MGAEGGSGERMNSADMPHIDKRKDGKGRDRWSGYMERTEMARKMTQTKRSSILVYPRI